MMAKGVWGLLLLLTAGIQLVQAHALITNVKGANGKNGVGLAVTRTKGRAIQLFAQAPRFLKAASSQICGQNRRKGGTKFYNINYKAEIRKAISLGLPSADQNGVVTMTLWQINRDGAGPYTCEVSTDASGRSFKPMKIRSQVPGRKGRSNAVMKGFTLRAQLPSGTKCTGSGKSCLVRCKNATNQPFGGCAVVTTFSSKKRDNLRSTSDDEDDFDFDGVNDDQIVYDDVPDVAEAFHDQEGEDIDLASMVEGDEDEAEKFEL